MAGGGPKAVVLARGAGRRMRRAEEGAPLAADQAATADRGLKGMIPVPRPFLDYVLSGLADAGFRDICLVVGPGADPVRAHYAAYAPLERIALSFAVQQEPRGTADAVLAAEAFAAGDPFLVINGDNYYPPAALAAIRRARPPAVALFSRDGLLRDEAIPPDRIASFAVARVDEAGVLTAIVEKPADTEVRARQGPVLVSMNCWLMPPAIFDACRRTPVSPRGEVELPQAVQHAIDVLGLRFAALAFDLPVLDLSRRGDIPKVTARLGGVVPRL